VPQLRLPHQGKGGSFEVPRLRSSAGLLRAQEGELLVVKRNKYDRSQPAGVGFYRILYLVDYRFRRERVSRIKRL
jgi:hypothetical protein